MDRIYALKRYADLISKFYSKEKMSYVSGYDLCCGIFLKIGQMTMQPNNPETLGDATGLLNALVSDLNRRGVSMSAVNEGISAANNARGHRKTIKVNWYQRGNSDDTSDVRDVCDGVEQDRLQVDFVADRYKQASFAINDETLRYMCEESSRLQANPLVPAPVTEEMARVLLSRLSGIRSAMNKDLNTLILPNVGNFANGVAGPKSVDVIYAATKAAVPARGITVSHDLNEASMGGYHFYVGFGNVYDSILSGSTGGSTDQGFDFRMYQQMVNAAFYPDVDMPNIFADPDDFLVLAQGLAQCATWNRNVADFAREAGSRREYDGTEYSTILPDPTIPNLVYDIDMVRKSCEKQWLVTISANYGLFTLPPDTFGATDRLFGVNGIFPYRGLAV